MKTHSKALKLTFGAAALAVLAAGAMALAPNSTQRSFAATPTPTPSSPSRIQGIPPIATPTPTPAPAGASPIRPIEPVAPVTTLPVCSNTNCPGPGAPRITHLENVTVAPGGLVRIDGTQFGTLSGLSTVYLVWTSVLVDNNYTQDRKLSLDIKDWQDRHVLAQVPDGVEGVPDQLAHVVLTNGSGQASADIQFMATRVVVNLGPGSDTHFDVFVNCSDASDVDYCDVPFAHHNDVGPYNLGVFGTDSYQVQLANGWGFWDLSICVECDQVGTDLGSATLGDASVKGDTTFSFSVYWSFSGFATEVHYDINLDVYGPKGVPLK